MAEQRGARPAAAHLDAAAVELLHQSLRDAEKRAALLTELIEALNVSRDALSLLQRSVEAVVRAIEASGAFVYLWDSDSGRFVLRAATEGHQKAFVGLISLRPGEGITGWSALMRRPVLVAQGLSDDPRVMLFPELQENEFRSCLIVPILVPGGDTLGVFSIYSVEEGAFDDGDMRLVDEVAQLLASGLDRAHVVDLWERQSTALDSLISAAESAPVDVRTCLTDLASRCMGIVPTDICLVESIETDGSPAESVAFALRRDVEAVSGGAAPLSVQAAKELARSTVPRMQSASVPLRIAERTLGVITCYRPAPFTPEDRSLLAAVAAYGSLALRGLANRGNVESVLGHLMACTAEEQAGAILERFGWTTGTEVVPVVVRCDPGLSLTSRRSLDSVVQTVESVFTGKRRRALPATSGIVAGLLFGGDHAGLAAEVEHDITTALTDKGQLVSAAVGVGRAGSSALAIVAELRAATDSAGWVALSPGGVRTAVVGQEDLTRTLLAVGRGLAPAVAAQVSLLQRLKDHDDRYGTDLLETMEVFVRERGAAQQASEHLFIHRNTLRQRLNKISSLLDQPIEQVDDWLPVSLAIEVLKSGDA